MAGFSTNGRFQYYRRRFSTGLQFSLVELNRSLSEGGQKNGERYTAEGVAIDDADDGAHEGVAAELVVVVHLSNSADSELQMSFFDANRLARLPPPELVWSPNRRVRHPSNLPLTYIDRLASLDKYLTPLGTNWDEIVSPHGVLELLLGVGAVHGMAEGVPAAGILRLAVSVRRRRRVVQEARVRQRLQTKLGVPY